MRGAANMDPPATDESGAVTPRAAYYRDKAQALLARLPTVTSIEARIELQALAGDHERLAEYLDTLSAKPPDPA